MDIEYHYYITGIIAQRAGFSDWEAYTIAYSSQYTDDNDGIYSIKTPGGKPYENYISQTMNILKPKRELVRIHPCFHFFPGTMEEIVNTEAHRKDGKLHVLNTIPNNTNARNLMQAAFTSKNLYRIGLATHTYVDTFAHQNFVGMEDSFNSMKGLLENIIPNIGHADARHDPDWPALVWKDDRIGSGHRKIDNKARFLTASGQLFTMYRNFLDPGCAAAKITRDKNKLLNDLYAAIGRHDKKNAKKKKRKERYKRLLGDGIKDYNKKRWFNKAIVTNYDDVMTGDYTYEWKEDNYKKSDWYRFQQAVIANQKTAMKILKPVFDRTEFAMADMW